MRTSEGNAVFAMIYSKIKKKNRFSKMDVKNNSVTVLILEKLCLFLSCCLCLVLNHL